MSFVQLDDAEDDELGDLHGEDVPLGFVRLHPGTVIAALLGLHRAAQVTGRHAEARVLGTEIVDTLGRRGGRRVGRVLREQVEFLGTSKFEACVRRAAGLVARQLEKIRDQLPEVVGESGVATLDAMGWRAFLPPIDPTPAEAHALLGHLALGASLTVGIGAGTLFLPDDHDVFEPITGAVLTIELGALPDVTSAVTARPRSMTKSGAWPDERSQEHADELLVRIRAGFGGVLAVLSHRGEIRETILIGTGEKRLEIELPQDPGGSVSLHPVSVEDAGSARESAQEDYHELLRRVFSDDVASDVLATLMTIHGDIPADSLMRLIELSPRIRPHLDRVNEFLTGLRGQRINDPRRELLDPLEAFLSREEQR